MAVYYGVIKHNQVDWEGDARPAEGARVEIRPLDQPTEAHHPDQDGAEAALLRDLVATGLLDAPPTDEFGADEPFTPVTVQGEPLSAQIIRERR